MRISYLKSIVIVLILVNCVTINNKHKDYQEDSVTINTIEPENTSAFTKNAIEKAKQLLNKGEYTPFEVLQEQKLNTSEVRSEIFVQTNNNPTLKSGNQIYNYLSERTLYIADSYLCEKCPNTHLTFASGFVIHEDGIIVTNYHVIDKKGLRSSAIFAVNHDGKVFSVSKVLSASKSNDIAVLQLDMRGEKLKFLELAKEEIVGEDVFVMGHPFNKTFFMSKGIVARKYFKNGNNVPKISITADFGIGSSGGPVVNNYGQLVGVVSATSSHYTKGSKKRGNLQMVIKEVVPVSVLNNYINKS